MVHTSTVAFAVLALKAASVLAAPTEYTSELAQREFDQDLDAREFDFEDMVERELFEFDEEIIARATTTSTSTSATSTATGANPTVTKATTTTTTHVAKPTGKNKKETKTVVITVLQPASKCKKLNAIQRLSLKIKAMRKHSQIKAEARRARRKARKEAIRNRRAGAKGAATTTSATSTPTSSASKTTTTAAATGTAASKTATANWMAITPPPTKSLAKGVIVKESKKKGKDGHTTIRRTVTAAPTACAVSSAKKSPHREYKQRSRRDLEDMEDLLEREYYFDELD